MKTLVYFTGGAVCLVRSLAVGTVQHHVLARSLCLAGPADMMCGMVCFAIEPAAWGRPALSRIVAEALASEALRGWSVRPEEGCTEPNPGNHYTLRNTSATFGFRSHGENHRTGLL